MLTADGWLTKSVITITSTKRNHALKCSASVGGGRGLPASICTWRSRALQLPRFDLSFLERIPRKALIAVPPVALFVVALGIALARSGGGSDQQPTVPASLGVRVGPDVAPTQ